MQAFGRGWVLSVVGMAYVCQKKKMKTQERVHRTKTVVSILLANKQLQERMKVYGFGKEALLEGQNFCQQVNTFSVLQQKEYGESYEATDALNIAKDEARSTYQRHLDIARLAFDKERGPWKTLQLGGRRKSALFGWLGQAKVFYGNVGPVADTLKKYNLTATELQQGEAMINAVVDAFEARRKEFNEAKLATKNKNLAIKDMRRWMSDFTRVAEVAFKDTPEALIKLGLKK